MLRMIATTVTGAALALPLISAPAAELSRSVSLDDSTGLSLTLPKEAAAYKAPYTVVRDHSRWHVHADGSSDRWVTIDSRIETTEGIDAIGQAEVDFNKTLEDMRIIEAYTLLPDGTRVDVAPDKIRLQDDRASGESIYSDSRIWVIIFPQVTVGARVVYSYHTRHHTPEFPGHFSASDQIPPHVAFESSKLEVLVDPGIDVRTWQREVRGGEVPAEPGDDPGSRRFRFEYSQAAQHAFEPGMVEPRQFAPGVSVSSFANYGQVAQAYQRRARPKAEPTAEIRALATKLTKDTPVLKEKVRILYEWVSRNIRYVGVYVGAGGFVPHDAQTVLDTRYGDCKDHVVILEAMLRAIGIESSPALVHTGNIHQLPELATPFTFNHAITYVPALDMFMDATAEFAPMGVLSGALKGQPALVAATGEVKTIPRRDLSQEFTETRVHMRLNQDGSVQGRSRMWAYGSYEPGARHELADLQRRPMDRVVSSWLSRSMESGRGQIDHPDPRDLREPWAVEAVFELDPVVNLPGPSALALPMGLAAGNIRDIVRAPVYLNRQKPRSCSPQRHVEFIELDLPVGLEMTAMPPDMTLIRDVYRYTARYERTATGLKATRELVIDHPKRVCDPASDRTWNEVAQQVRRDLRAQVFLR